MSTEEAARIQAVSGACLSVHPQDAPLLQRHAWHAHGMRNSGAPYWMAKMGRGFKVFLHLLVAGTPPDAECSLMFIDGDPSNVQLSNLAWVTQAVLAHQRARPKRKADSPPFIGVIKLKGPVFMAKLAVGHRSLRGPSRHSSVEAARDYDALATRIHGPWARLNFPEETILPAKPSLASMPPVMPRLVDGRGILCDSWAQELIGRHRWWLDPDLGPVARIGVHTVQLAWIILGCPRFMAYKVEWLNGDQLDCRDQNLKWTRLPSTIHQRAQVRRMQVLLGEGALVGVRRTPGGRYSASMRPGRRTRFLGVYDSKAEAGQAYDNAARAVYGDSAAVNFPKPAKKSDGGSHG